VPIRFFLLIQSLCAAVSKSTLAPLAQFLELPGFPHHATFMRNPEPPIFRSQTSPLDRVGDIAQKKQRFDAEVGFFFLHALPTKVPKKDLQSNSPGTTVSYTSFRRGPDVARFRSPAEHAFPVPALNWAEGSNFAPLAPTSALREAGYDQRRFHHLATGSTSISRAFSTACSTTSRTASAE